MRDVVVVSRHHGRSGPQASTLRSSLGILDKNENYVVFPALIACTRAHQNIIRSIKKLKHTQKTNTTCYPKRLPRARRGAAEERYARSCMSAQIAEHNSATQAPDETETLYICMPVPGTRVGWQPRALTANRSSTAEATEQQQGGAG